eukprot:scaffold1199_cov265-Pinguiococcus_pyrenoidosus.AAC.30
MSESTKPERPLVEGTKEREGEKERERDRPENFANRRRSGQLASLRICFAQHVCMSALLGHVEAVADEMSGFGRKQMRKASYGNSRLTTN